MAKKKEKKSRFMVEREKSNKTLSSQEIVEIPKKKEKEREKKGRFTFEREKKSSFIIEKLAHLPKAGNEMQTSGSFLLSHHGLSKSEEKLNNLSNSSQISIKDRQRSQSVYNSTNFLAASALQNIISMDSSSLTSVRTAPLTKQKYPPLAESLFKDLNSTVAMDTTQLKSIVFGRKSSLAVGRQKPVDMKKAPNAE